MIKYHFCIPFNHFQYTYVYTIIRYLWLLINNDCYLI